MSEELARDELARSLYRLNTLYELNQEISTLGNINDVLKSSLLYIIGLFGFQRGLIAIYRDEDVQPHEFVYRGMSKNTGYSYLWKTK